MGQKMNELKRWKDERVKNKGNLRKIIKDDNFILLIKNFA